MSFKVRMTLIKLSESIGDINKDNSYDDFEEFNDPVNNQKKS